MGGKPPSQPKPPAPPPPPTPKEIDDKRKDEKKARGKKTKTDFTGKLGLSNQQKSNTALKNLTGQ